MSVGLQLRGLQKFRGRARARGLDDFIVRHVDLATCVLLLEQDLLHELIEDFLLELLFLIQGELAAQPLRGLLLLAADRLEPDREGDVAAVDGGDDARRRIGAATQET